MKKHILFLLSLSLIIGVCQAQGLQTKGFNLGNTSINYQTATIALTVINSALVSMNAAGIHPGWQAQYTQGIGILTGAFQLAYGLINSSGSNQALNLVNDGVGAATLITSAIQFYNTFHPHRKSTSWNIYYSPLKKNNPGFGIRVVKRFKI